jgi:oligo-1,6-glucosidase
VIANCGREPRTVELGPEWVDAELLLGNLPDTPMTSMSSPSLEVWDARTYALGDSTAGLPEGRDQA